ncbi:hypothetical protein IFM89_035504 [Coptis chinensis]|uniref:C2 domain-containing protein n=1 Tax=Coptis chinensis TaxID=261450 RepID=A0A835HAI5_9MAGN|nr:hypothetical protein IFM89_035504 [Coptis chinensis]
MSSSSRFSTHPLDLDITIITAKHLKNVNWRHGELKPYVTISIDPTRRFTTKPSDDINTNRPIWNERFIIPINIPLHDALLSLEISHSEISQTPSLKPVGSVQFPLKELISNSDESNTIRVLELRRPSGRPQGKIRVKLGLRERERPTPPPPQPDYHPTPPNYYNPSTLPRDYRNYPSPSSYSPYSPPFAPAAAPSSPYSYTNYSDPNYGYYSSGYYSSQQQLPPMPPRPLFDQGMRSYDGHSGPSAPVDYSSTYEQKAKGSKMGMGGKFGSGLAVGAVAGALGGLALEEGLKFEEGKIADKVENELDGRDEYSDYRPAGHY